MTPPNDFVCNRIGPGHKFGSRFCAACAPENPRITWLREYVEYDPDHDDGSPPGPAPDRVTSAAAALGDYYGWYYDPVLSPETALDIVGLVLDAVGSGEPDER